MDELIFSDEPIESKVVWEDWEEAPEFAPPPPAGIYRMHVALVREQRAFKNRDGADRFGATVDYRIIGGEYDDRAITFVRLSNAEFERNGKYTSTLADLAHAIGQKEALRSNRDFQQWLLAMVAQGKQNFFTAQLEWRGFCTTCNEKALMRVTFTGSAAEAKEKATPEQYTEAQKEGTKAKSARGFPKDKDGKTLDTFLCDSCKNEVRARAEIRRYLDPVKVAANGGA